MSSKPFPTAQFIKEIGRGKAGARALGTDVVEQLFDAIFDGAVSDLELGAILLAYRIKGESADELAGMLKAVHRRMRLLQVPATALPPVVLPCYNGARNLPNLTALLALLLAREGVPVLLHGVVHHTDHGNLDIGPDRVTTAEVWQGLGRSFAASLDQADAQLLAGQPVFVPIGLLAPHLDQLLRLRKRLGVRNSAHTLAKLLQPFAGPALRLTSFTHPEYAAILAEHFTRHGGDAFVMRGTEGEVVSNARKGNQIDWYREGQKSTLVETQAAAAAVPGLPDTRTPAATADYIQAVLEGRESVPVPIAQQVESCLQAVHAMRNT
jgi:anthranilate phosphoribosyltransferase